MTVATTMATTTSRRGPGIGWWFVLVSSLGLAIYSWRFAMVSTATLFGELPASEETLDGHIRLLLEQNWLRFAAHFIFGPIALITGPWQFHAGFRRARPVLHRRIGYVYATSVGIAGVAGLILAAGSFGGLVTHTGFGLLAVLWLYFTASAVVLARRKKFAQHRVQMLRSFALTYGAVTLRFLIPLLMIAGYPLEQVYQTVAWLSWVPNLLFIELFWLTRNRRAGAEVVV